ncbi:MAG: hypothetical protein IT373_16985 [Polyangiaceae bacterium]|nr:hypothetical protein [Polyangiaceae bacterium]
MARRPGSVTAAAGVAPRRRARSERPSGVGRVVDAEALFMALVLAPQSYPRNRFPWLFELPEARRARRRAALLRSLVRDLRRPPAPERWLDVEAAPGGGAVLRSSDRALGLERRTVLDEVELALLLYVLERCAPEAPLLEHAACRSLVAGAGLAARVDDSLARLLGPRRRRARSEPQGG